LRSVQRFSTWYLSPSELREESSNPFKRSIVVVTRVFRKEFDDYIILYLSCSRVADTICERAAALSKMSARQASARRGDQAR
jgi:hypothetical protein